MKVEVKNNSESLLFLNNPYLGLELEVPAKKTAKLDEATEAQVAYLNTTAEILNYEVILKDEVVASVKVDKKNYTEDELKNYTVAQLTDIAKTLGLKLEGKQDSANLIKAILESK